MRRRGVLVAMVLAFSLIALPASAAQTGSVDANGKCVTLAHGGITQLGNVNSQGKAIGLHRAHQASDAIAGTNC